MKLFKKIIMSPWTALITMCFLVCIRVADPSFVESIRLRYFDTLISNKEPTTNNKDSSNTDTPYTIITMFVFRRNLQSITLAPKNTPNDIKKSTSCLSKNDVSPTNEFIVTSPAHTITQTLPVRTQSIPENTRDKRFIIQSRLIC